MKNAFTEDNSTGAASAGKKLEAAFKNFDKSALTAAQKKTYEDVEADAIEHAEHIGASGGNIAHHIKQAKNELNFNEFGTYSQRRQLSKLDGIANSIKDEIMPLKSYGLMHKPARLSTDEKSLLINWAQQSIDNMPVKN
jgi:hypothetical protein